MRRLWSIAFLCIITMSSQESFKEKQLGYERVKCATERIGNQVRESLADCGIQDHPFELYLRAFKKEAELELWVKAENASEFILLNSYVICASSGLLGPKRKQGDLQVPQGFYTIDRFNPLSNYHLSLGLNYPNPSDRERGDKDKLGGDIFIHGNCVTIGCLPMTDAVIEEIYLYCIEAKDRSNQNISVHLFPMRMEGKEWSSFRAMQNEDEVSELYSSLEQAYIGFEKTKNRPKVSFLASGNHSVQMD